MTSALRLAGFALPLLLAGPAAAHHPMGGEVPATLWQGLASGFAHPIIGLDHLAFLLAVGLIAGLARQGLARPLLFVVASLAGVTTAWLGLVLPGAEWLVLATVLVAGAVLVAGWRIAPAAWLGLLALAGLAHGQAYAEAVLGAEPTPVLAYLAGLALVQGGMVALVVRLARGLPVLVPRLAGGAVVAVGLLALV
ncbi:HupE/UreJ family protein [Falsiroseomonas sp. E2-1-a20]|uniref:HupE/UreJ family protein n=1 Tax=Falsiroseomonas sp. E2-1-a20 TaxID=3239300 RepID=UPI003F3C494B